MSQPPAPAPARRSGWARALWLALLIYSAALFFLFRSPVVLIPPYQQATTIIYMILVLLWPLLLILAVVSVLRGRWGRIVTALLAGGLLYCMFLVLVGPVLGAVWSTAGGSPCEVQSSGERVRMTCQAGSDPVTFEQRGRLPLMWLTDDPSLP